MLLTQCKLISQTLSSMLFGVALACCSLARADEEPKVLNFYNWVDYIGKDTIKNFEKETGIKVVFDSYDSNEVLHAKLVAGRTGYDVVVPSTNFSKMQLQSGLFRKLDKSLLTNWSNLDQRLLELVGQADPGNQYLVGWLWGYTTVGINVDMVKKALGSEVMPDNAWDLVFNPKYTSKLKSCGIGFLDAPSEVFPAALNYLGKPAYSRNLADYQEAAKLLAAMRRDISVFSMTGYIDDLANGNVCVVLGWSGDINIARQRAIEANSGRKIQALIPTIGGTITFDAMAIPVDAPHPKNAHLFINYILRPEVHAGITNQVNYANPNAASLKFVKPEIANNKSTFLSEADMKKMIAPDTVNNDIRRTMNRLYTRFKTGV